MTKLFTSFEEYLKEEHAKVSTAFDDDMPDAFEHWLAEMDMDDVIGFAEEWGSLIFDWGQLQEAKKHDPLI